MIEIEGFTQNIDIHRNWNSDTLQSQKIEILKYSGGRFGYSGIYLSLFSDSTYIYSCWLDNGFSFNDEGRYLIIDATITLCSNGYSKDKMNKKKNKHANFENETYRMEEDKILLYTEKQEKKDKSNFYSSYYTLYLDHVTYKK
jgi:hypothetical protein